MGSEVNFPTLQMQLMQQIRFENCYIQYALPEEFVSYAILRLRDISHAFTEVCPCEAAAPSLKAFAASTVKVI